jgi:hypothetical protein
MPSLCEEEQIHLCSCSLWIFPAWFQALWHFATRYCCLVLFVSVLVSITSNSSILYAFSALVRNWIRWSPSSSGHLQSVKWASNWQSIEGLKIRSLPGTKQKISKPHWKFRADRPSSYNTVIIVMIVVNCEPYSEDVCSSGGIAAHILNLNDKWMSVASVTL